MLEAPRNFDVRGVREGVLVDRIPQLGWQLEERRRPDGLVVLLVKVSCTWTLRSLDISLSSYPFRTLVAPFLNGNRLAFLCHVRSSDVPVWRKWMIEREIARIQWRHLMKAAGTETDE